MLYGYIFATTRLITPHWSIIDQQFSTSIIGLNENHESRHGTPNMHAAIRYYENDDEEDFSN